MDYLWLKWIGNNWDRLEKGKRIPTPLKLPHPAFSGFKKPDLAENVGQSWDWVCSMKDGSRIHLHEYSSGKIVAHRDKVDPARGSIDAVWHWLTESQSGKIVALGLLVAAFHNSRQSE